MKNLLPILILHFILCHQGITQNESGNHKKTDLPELENYINTLVQEEMIKSNVPGAVVVIVQDSQTYFINGYGYADVENELEVDPMKTGFRIASVTKTFTATAILQLVQSEKLDLHAPISEYLPDDNFSFLKDDDFTIHQLLTHTAGIDLTDIGDAAVIPENIVPLEEFVRSHIPDQVNKPGEVHSYSNFGYTILGYLIQEVSGMSYENYIRANILDPLGMQMSSMNQPLDEPFSSNMAKSYKWDDKMIHLPRDYTNTVPGGGLISTGNDMLQYMLMHLNQGSLDSVQILDTAHHNLLTSQQYGSKNTKYGICYSFFENGWTGRRSIDHTGGQLGFLSLFLLIPETGTGIFITHNSRANTSGFRYDITRAVLDTLLYRKERHIELPEPSEDFISIAKNYVGRYQQMNYPHSSYEKFGQLFGFFNSAYVVKYENDGLLTLNGSKYVMIEKDLFHRYDESSPWNVAFELDEKGRAQRIVAGLISYNLTPWYESKKVWQRLLAAALLLQIINLLVKPIRTLYFKLKKVTPSHSLTTSGFSWQNWTGGLLLAGLFGTILNLVIYGGQLADYGVPLSFKIPLIIITAGAILSVYAPVELYKLWQSDQSTGQRMWRTLMVISIMVLVVGFWKFNIIGFQF